MRDLHSPQAAAQWLRENVTGCLQTDSRKLAPGDGFIAWPGAAHDARAHVADALVNGTAACLVEHAGVSPFGFDDPRIASYTGLKIASSHVAAAFYDAPSERVRVLAVTGTNGKTSTAWWLAQALSSAMLDPALPCAMIGTLGVGRPPAANMDGALDANGLTSLMATGLTTPDPVLLQTSLKHFADAGVAACALEASSIGIDEYRLDGIHIHTAIFTNFTQDHLDYHGSMDAYWRAKSRLFQWPGLQAAVVNIDDPKGGELLALIANRPLDVWTISCTAPARLRASDISLAGAGLSFQVTEGQEQHLLQTRLIGHYNVSNLLGVLAAMRASGVPLDRAVQACATLAPVPGRMQCLVQDGMPLLAVDYAHTPDALDKALAALRPLSQDRGGKLWCVFGCGGDRDPGKRPAMGAAAGAADHVVVTSDNPRSEDPLAIIAQIVPALAGHASVTQQADRARAIEQTVLAAAGADVVLLAGKGHEVYQEVAGQRHPFSDLAHAQAALAIRRISQATQGVCA